MKHLYILLLFAMMPFLAGCKEQVSGTWRYKMTVTVETPEGDVSGSAVHEMSNSTPLIDLPDVGNPASIRGEAVVVDLGDRGVLFVLMDDYVGSRFYRAFPISGEKGKIGGTTNEGIIYYANLPVGTKGVVNPKKNPSYPKFVTFTNPEDPKSITVIQKWERQGLGVYAPKEDRIEEFFGQGVKIKDITLEITDEPKTDSNILDEIPQFDDEFWAWFKTLKYGDPRRVSGVNFKGRL